MLPVERQEKLSVGPRFIRSRVVVMCKRADGKYFLLCSCFLYQRELRVCECCLAVKRKCVDPFGDIHFRYHVLYEREAARTPADYVRSSSEGQLDGPGIKGIPQSELLRATSDVPASRTGLRAWLAEFGSSLVPLSEPIWGRPISLQLWNQEATGQDLEHHAEESRDSEEHNEADVEDNNEVPEWVTTPQHFYRFYQQRMTDLVGSQARIIGRSATRTDFTTSLHAAQAQMADLELYLSRRHPGQGRREKR